MTQYSKIRKTHLCVKFTWVLLWWRSKQRGYLPLSWCHVQFVISNICAQVRAVRPVHRDVLLPQQAHHDRPGHRQQQQNQLAAGGQAGDDRHHRDGVPRSAQGPRSRRVAQGLLHQVPILSGTRHHRFCARARELRTACSQHYAWTRGGTRHRPVPFGLLGGGMKGITNKNFLYLRRNFLILYINGCQYTMPWKLPRVLYCAVSDGWE